MGLKLYAQLDRESVRKLTEAAHRVGMPVWGHAWVQPASALEQVHGGSGRRGARRRAGRRAVLREEERDTLVNDGNLQVATAEVATVGSAHDPSILAGPRSHGRDAAPSSSRPWTPPATAWPTSTPSGGTFPPSRRSTCGPPQASESR